jgi:hypothetical protein
MTAGGDETAAALRASHQAQRDGILAGEADALGQLLSGDFTVTHMT